MNNMTITGLGIASVNVSEYADTPVVQNYNTDMSFIKNILDKRPDNPNISSATTQVTGRDYDNLVLALQDLQNLVQNGLPVTTSSGTTYQGYINGTMASNINGVMKTLQVAGISAVSPSGLTDDQKVQALQAWQSLAGFGVEQIVYTAATVYLPKPTQIAPGVTAVITPSPAQTFQSMLELHYVKTANDVVFDNLNSLQGALSTSNQMLLTLNNIQGIMNEISISSPIGFVFPPKTNGDLGFGIGAKMSAFILQVDGTFQGQISSINAALKDLSAQVFRAVDHVAVQGGGTIFNFHSVTLSERHAIFPFDSIKSAALYLSGGGAVTPDSFLDALSRLTNGFGSFSFGQQFNFIIYASEDLNTIYPSFLNGNVLVHFASAVLHPAYPSAGASQLLQMYHSDVLAAGGNNTAIFNQMTNLADYITSQIQGNSSTFRNEYIKVASAYFTELFPTAAPNAQAATQLLAFKQALSAEVALVLAQSPPAAINDPNSLYTTGKIVLHDMSGIFGSLSANSDPNQLLAAVKMFILDNQNIASSNANASLSGKVQAHLTQAITSAENLSTTQRDSVRQFMQIFQEFYKSTAAMLTLLGQVFDKIGNNIGGG